MEKREWCWIQKPTIYEITCDLCRGQNITWSEFEGMIFCYDCKKNTRGTSGIFGGPIPMELCAMYGISFDRIHLKTEKRMKECLVGNHIEWMMCVY